MRHLLVLASFGFRALATSQELLEPGCSAPALLQAERHEIAGEAAPKEEEPHGNPSHHGKVTDSKVKKHKELPSDEHSVAQKSKSKEVLGDEPSTDQKDDASRGSAAKMPSYKKIDKNSDGVMTPKEFQDESKRVIHKLHEQIHKALEQSDKLEKQKLAIEKEIDMMPSYEDIDINRDGVVTPAEHSQFSAKSSLAESLSYKALDANNDGAVTPQEFKLASEKWTAEMARRVEKKRQDIAEVREQRRQSEEQIDELATYNDLDLRRDGVVTPQEYITEKELRDGNWSVQNRTLPNRTANGTSTSSVKKWWDDFLALFH